MKNIVNNYTKNTFLGTLGALVVYGTAKSIIKGAAVGIAAWKLKRAAEKAAQEIEEETK